MLTLRSGIDRPKADLGLACTETPSNHSLTHDGEQPTCPSLLFDLPTDILIFL